MRHIMRIAGAAVVFAVLALAPTAAKAHSGHSHAPSVQQSSSAETTQAETTQDAAKAADSVQKRAPQFIVKFIAASETGDEPAGKNGCSGTCCKTAMACCVVIFNDPGETPLPPGIATRLPFPEAASWASLASDRLRRPPKSFA